MVFLRGTARNVPFQFPAGTLAGRQFTATLNAVSLSVSILGDVLTVSVTVAQTNAAAAGQLPFVLTETTSTAQPFVIGSWEASVDANRVSPQQTFTVTTNTETLQLQVIGGTNLPQIVSSDPAKLSVTTALGVTTLGVEKVAPAAAWLTANSSAVNNSTTLVNVTGLVVPVVANATYIVECGLIYASTTVADLNIGWTVPAGVSGQWF